MSPGITLSLRAPQWAPIEQRLRNNSSRSDNGCLIWTGSVVGNRMKRGRIFWNGRNEYVPRVAWVLKNGPIPPGFKVCHHCDEPLCFEDDHLFLGTQRDNMRDMAMKRRGGCYGLDPPTVAGIFLDRRQTKLIAAEHGVSPRKIQKIKRRDLYAAWTEGL